MSTFVRRKNAVDRPSGRAALGFVGAVGIRRVSAALAGRYTVLKQLAGSGSAEFYLARPVGSGKGLVKIKVLAPRAACDSRKRELFRLEARASSKLDHGNIVRSSEAVVIDSIHLCAIEHRPCVETLRDLIQRKGWLDLDHTVRIFNQIAGAVGHAHKSGILHLRLSPDNVLIEPNGRVFVTDFGIEAGDEMAWAHRERSQTSNATYVSVEQILDKALDQRSDIYALGLMLYEMLTDRVPFESPDTGYLKRQRVAHSPLPPLMLSTGVASELSDIVMCLLEREPGGRPGRVEVVQRALTNLLKESEAAASQGDDLTMSAAH